MGWTNLEYVAMSRPGADTVWSAFQQGFTADEARLKLYARFRQWCIDNGEPVPAAGDGAARSTVHVYGDLYTRLHGVYTGTDADSPMTAWYR